MALDCISGFITFRVVCPGGVYRKPASGLHFEDLPGFSTASLAAVEPGKYLDAKTYADEKLRIAGQMILEQMRAHLDPYIEEGRPKESGVIGTFSADTLAGDTSIRGIRVRVDGGPMTVPVVPRVWLRCVDDVPDLELTVTDGLTTHTVLVDVKGSGVDNEVWLNFEGRKKAVDITIEDARFVPFTGSAEGTMYFSSCTTCGGHARYKYIAGGGLKDGVESIKLQGMTAEAVTMCSIEPVACVLLHRFKFAVLYQWGILALEEWIASSRTNYFTIHSKDWAVASMEKWQEVDLKTHMKAPTKALASYVAQLDPSCLECGSGNNFAYARP